jgi:ABC-type nitrate/sulfonate/bicarbonate transport system substrate-binding protein
MSNLFSSTEEFYDAHPEAAAAFLVLWQRGIDAWSDPEIQAEIIATYPQHFAVEEEEDIAFIQEFMAGENDWFVDDVYLTEEWIEAEKAIWDFMVDLDEGNQNKLNPDFPDPRFEVIEKPA